MNDMIIVNLNPAQSDGLACVVCKVSFVVSSVPHIPVGRSEKTGSQVFACSTHFTQEELNGE